MRGALQEQVKPDERLFILPCTPTQTSDHQPGQKATGLLIRQAVQKAGTSYSLFGAVRVSVIQATAAHTPHPLVFLSFKASGTWIYGLTPTAQEQIKALIAGKSKQQALQVLASLPGVERVYIAWGDDTRLPKDSSYIHISLFVA